MKIVPVILSGGSGSRLWPVSRTVHPKQFIHGLVANEGNLSLFQLTLIRLAGLQDQATKPIGCLQWPASVSGSAAIA